LQFRSSQKHINTLSAHVYPENSAAQQMFEAMKALFMHQGSSAATATQQAHQAMWGTVQRQAAMLSYNDTFFFMAMMFVAMLPFLLLLRKPKAAKAGAAMMH
jgi:MFS transporter, DHA2 family, multidrug resistance protein